MKNLLIGGLAAVIGLFILGELLYNRTALGSTEMSGLIGGVVLLAIGINRLWVWKKERAESAG